jgi:hypothetical protein
MRGLRAVEGRGRREGMVVLETLLVVLVVVLVLSPFAAALPRDYSRPQSCEVSGLPFDMLHVHTCDWGPGVLE